MTGLGPLGGFPLGATPGGSGTIVIEYLTTTADAVLALNTELARRLVDSANAEQTLDIQLARLMADSASASELFDALSVKVLTDNAAAAAVLVASGTYLRTLANTAEASEALRAAFRAVISDEASASETLDQIIQRYAYLRDRVLATDALSTSLTAASLLFSTALSADLAANAFSASLSDSAAAAQALLSRAVAVGALLDDAEASAQLDNSLRVFGFLADGADAAASLTSAAQLLGLLSSGAAAAIILTLGGAEYTAWVLNTENIAVSQYDQYPFNSYTEFAGAYFGAASDGVYALRGDTDAGAPIQAYFRAPLTDYGIASLKRSPEFYFGYTSDGDLLLKVLVVSPNGVKEEHWYRLEARPGGLAGGTRETRTKPGKGLESVYWQYELHNINGADFQMEVVRMWPMALTRRVR